MCTSDSVKRPSSHHDHQRGKHGQHLSPLLSPRHWSLLPSELADSQWDISVARGFRFSFLSPVCEVLVDDIGELIGEDMSTAAFFALQDDIVRTRPNCSVVLEAVTMFMIVVIIIGRFRAPASYTISSGLCKGSSVIAALLMRL